MIPNHDVWRAVIAVKETIPIAIMGKVATLPVVGSEKLKKFADTAKTVSNKMIELQTIFRYFINNQWIYEVKQSPEILKYMSAEEKQIFNHDIKSIDWRRCISNFSYGLRRYFIKEDLVNPATHFE